MARTKKVIPAAVRRAVAEASDGSCHYCGKAGRIRSYGAWVWFEHELDHKHPEYLGGTATVDNIVLACRPCNRSKGYKTVEGWQS